MILITGATGTVGRQLVDALTSRHVAVRAVTRSGAGALPAGVESVTADLARPESLAPALEGVSTLFVHPRAVGERAGKLLAMAAEHGVRRSSYCRQSTSTMIRRTSRRGRTGTATRKSKTR